MLFFLITFYVTYMHLYIESTKWRSVSSRIDQLLHDVLSIAPIIDHETHITVENIYFLRKLSRKYLSPLPMSRSREEKYICDSKYAERPPAVKLSLG